MPTPVFKLTAMDLQTEINPAGQDGYFKVGTGTMKVPTAIVDGKLLNHESRVCSSVPEKWRKMFNRIEGLIGIRFAEAGQTTFTIPIIPTGDVQVFLNYPSNFGNGMKVHTCNGTLKPYASRTASDSLSGWTLDSETGEITLPVALSSGDHVVVDFDHDSMDQCHELRMCVLELAAADMLRGWPTMSENVNDKIAGLEKNAQLFLTRLWNGENAYRTGIQFFDRLRLVSEMETRQSGGIRPIAPGYGALL